MRLFRASEIGEWDQYTMQHEPIASIDLMERAAYNLCVQLEKLGKHERVGILVGPGNNGGDGLVLARLFAQEGRIVQVFLLASREKSSPDNQANLDRLPDEVEVLDVTNDLSALEESNADLWIDSVFGYGLARPVEGRFGESLDLVNAKSGVKVAVDIPSGLYCDDNSENPLQHVFRADHTYTFQVIKRSMLFGEYAEYFGQVHVVDIGLHAGFEPKSVGGEWLTGSTDAASLIQPLSDHAHKYSLGHAGIVGGSEQALGAVLLSAMAAMRTGAGLVSLGAPGIVDTPLRSLAPEVMRMPTTGETLLESVEVPDKVTALGIGPGMGVQKSSVAVLDKLLDTKLPLVLDADALNIIAQESWLDRVSPSSILTPHIGEFARLFEKQDSPELRLEKAKAWCTQSGAVILLKGRYSAIISPDGSIRFNTSGNPGMATAGSGDVLLGVVTALRAQGYGATEAAVLGAYLHGLAGDLTAEEIGPRGVIARDIIDYLPLSWSELESSTSS